MQFDLNEEQQAVAESLSRLLNDHYSFAQRSAIAQSPPGWSEALWSRLAALGVTALGIPESSGGLGGGARDRLAVMQHFGRALLLEPYLTSSVLCATALATAASDAQKDRLLPSLADGSLRMAWAHDEAGAEHADLLIQTRARREGDRWLLDGSKSLVLHAGAAHCFVVSARLGGQAGDEDGVALFLVQAGDALQRDFRLIDDTPAGELTFNATPAQALGDANDGARAVAAIRAAIAAGTAAVCADMVGSMEAAFALTTAYVNTRKQFGRLIGEYQALRHRVAEMAVALEMARSMAIAAAVAVDQPDSPHAATDLPRAKLAIGRYARALCQQAIQSHGGIGMTQEYAVGHCLRRVHVLDQLFGDVDVQTARLAQR